MRKGKYFLLLCMIILAFALVGCNNMSDKSSDSSEVSQTTSAIVPETTIPEETAKATSTPAPTSSPVVTTKAVDLYGQLQVVGTNLCDETGAPVVLKGMSTHAIQYTDTYYNEEIFKTLAQDWGCTVIRLAVYTEEGGYIDNPDRYYESTCKAIDLAVAEGMYVIVDWHILSDGDPMTHITESLDFFQKISDKYKDCPNIIYEICNEPNSGHADDPAAVVTWADNIKPYAEQVVAVIRDNDPDNVIIIGSSNWSQDVDIAAADPVEGTNLMYSLHFYAGSHGQELRDKMDAAISLGAAIFVTEWGTTNNTGAGELYLTESDEWLSYLEEKNISWCNWSILSSIAESTNALKFSTNSISFDEKAAGHWPDSMISNSGLYVRCQILGIPYEES